MPIQKIGFIGGGNMACAMIDKIKTTMQVQLAVSDPAATKADAMRIPSNRELAQWADMIVFAVKPHIMPAAIADVAPVARDKPFVSVAAGVATWALQNQLPGARVLRAMPNTPVSVGQGMSVLSTRHNLKPPEFAFVNQMFACLGDVLEIDEESMAAVTAISGSGPAYFFIMIEAMADAGVRNGLPRDIAYRLAAQTAIGAGAMVRETGRHPGTLKDDVCSPRGTTIAAVEALEHGGFRAAVMDAVHAAHQRAKELE